MSLLKEFWENKPMLAEVQEHITSVLERESVRRVFASEDVKGLGEAKKLLDKAFKEMDELFAIEEKPKNVPNPAR